MHNGCVYFDKGMVFVIFFSYQTVYSGDIDPLFQSTDPPV